MKEKINAGENVDLITWEIVSYRKGNGEEMKIDGFSAVFYANGKITGEWISYSDLQWVMGLGYTLNPPG